MTETWLTDDLPDETLELNGYTIVRKDRADYINGGAVCIYIYIRNTIPFRFRLDLSHSSIECVWAISNIALATIYLPPSFANVDIDEFYGIDTYFGEY